jgi:hypothetical protein
VIEFLLELGLFKLNDLGRLLGAQNKVIDREEIPVGTRGFENPMKVRVIEVIAQGTLKLKGKQGIEFVSLDDDVHIIGFSIGEDG